MIFYERWKTIIVLVRYSVQNWGVWKREKASRPGFFPLPVRLHPVLEKWKEKTMRKRNQESNFVIVVTRLLNGYVEKKWRKISKYMEKIDNTDDYPPTDGAHAIFSCCIIYLSQFFNFHYFKNTTSRSSLLHFCTNNSRMFFFVVFVILKKGCWSLSQ